MTKILRASEIESLTRLEADTTIIVNASTKIFIESVSKDKELVNISGHYEKKGRKGYISGRLADVSSWLDI